MPENEVNGLIIPDYTMPSALMVPHYPVDSHALLESIAKAAAAHVGVILLSQNPKASQRFIEQQPDPKQFTVVGAMFDTPWIRDRSPIAIRSGKETHWVLPQLPAMNREQDDRLFKTLTVKPTGLSRLKVEQGNLVAGPNGLVLSTHRVLRENGFSKVSELVDAAGPLGIRQWVLFPPFVKELSAHADVHARFLSPELLAVAWNPEDRSNQETVLRIIEQVEIAIPLIEILRIPIRRKGKHYASLVNWIQLADMLLIPRFKQTPERDLEETRQILKERGFACHFINSPTDKLGGSLHCLTASVFV